MTYDVGSIKKPKKLEGQLPLCIEDIRQGMHLLPDPRQRGGQGGKGSGLVDSTFPNAFPGGSRPISPKGRTRNFRRITVQP